MEAWLSQRKSVITSAKRKRNGRHFDYEHFNQEDTLMGILHDFDGSNACSYVVS